MCLFNFIAANDNGFKLTPWCVSDAFTSCSIFQFPCHICTPCTLYLNIQPTSVRWLIGFLQHICHLHSPPPSPWPFLLSSPFLFLFLFLPPLVFPLILRLNLSSFLLFPLLPLSLFLSYLLSPLLLPISPTFFATHDLAADSRPSLPCHGHFLQPDATPGLLLSRSVSLAHLYSRLLK